MAERYTDLRKAGSGKREAGNRKLVARKAENGKLVVRKLVAGNGKLETGSW